MRLIDTDKLEYRTDRTGFGYIMEWEVHSAPTVPAIPIEWFKNLIKTIEDSKNYEESEILKWVLNKWENQEKEK